MIYFYHISRDATDEKVYELKQGIKPGKGKGYGGQSSGFYCWTSEDQADKCFTKWAIGTDFAWAKEKFGKDISLKNGTEIKYVDSTIAEASEQTNIQSNMLSIYTSKKKIHNI